MRHLAVVAIACSCLPLPCQALAIRTVAHGSYSIVGISTYTPGFVEVPNATPFTPGFMAFFGSIPRYPTASITYAETVASSQVEITIGENYFSPGPSEVAGSSRDAALPPHAYQRGPHAILVTVTGPPAAAGILTFELTLLGGIGALVASLDIHNDNAIEARATTSGYASFPVALNAAGSLVVRVETDGGVAAGYSYASIRLAFRLAPVPLPGFGTTCSSGGFAATGSLGSAGGAWQATFQAGLPYTAPIVLAVAGLQQQLRLLPGGCSLLVSPDATWLRTSTNSMTLPLSFPSTVRGTLYVQFVAMPPTGPFRVDASNGVRLTLPF